MEGAAYLLTIHVLKISVQPPKLNPTATPAELEVVRFKRALVSMEVEEGTEQSAVLGVLEYQGKTLTLSLTKGNCELLRVANALAIDYYLRYGKKGLIPIGNRNDS